MICEVMEMVGGETERVRDHQAMGGGQGGFYAYSWSIPRTGADNCSVYLKVFHEPRNASSLFKSFAPRKAYSKAPNLYTLAVSHEYESRVHAWRRH